MGSSRDGKVSQNVIPEVSEPDTRHTNPVSIFFGAFFAVASRYVAPSSPIPTKLIIDNRRKTS